MGLRCLLGHAYGDTRTEREREERGDELVVTVTEVEECSRCGETRVVSENTEVTRRSETAAPEPAEDGPETETDQSSDASGTPNRSSVVDEEVDVVIDEAESDEEFGGSAEPRPESEPAVSDRGEPSDATASAGGTGDATQSDPATDDAEIIDADDSEPASDPERNPGEWPDEETTHPADATADDDAEFVDADPVEESDAAADARRDVVDDVNPEGASTAPESEDTEIMDADAGATGRDSVGRGSTDDPSVSDRSGRSPDHGTATDHGAGGGDSTAGGGPTGGAGSAGGTGPTNEAGSPDDSGWPSHDEDADEGYDAEVGADDAGDVSVDGSLQPDVDPETVADEDVEFIESSPDPSHRDTNGASGSHETEETAGFDGLPEDVTETAGTDTTATPSGTPGQSRPHVDLSTEQQETDSEYFCPDCGHAESVGASSMRKGDICPECMKGYIDERAVE